MRPGWHLAPVSAWLLSFAPNVLLLEPDPALEGSEAMQELPQQFQALCTKVQCKIRA